MNRRKEAISYIDYNEDDPEPIYCPYCEKVGVKVKLQPRVYDDNQPLPYDADQWLQCYTCGKIIPIYAGKLDVEYGPVVDMVETHFDVGSKFAGTDRRSKKRRRKKEVKDPDKELERGVVKVLYDSQGNY
jgi:hypothetical protein